MPEIVAVVMGETLAAGSEAIEMIGRHLEIDMAKLWTPDTAFWSLIRDKEVLGRIVAEVAGEEVAAANSGKKAAVLKSIVTDHRDGTNGRPQRAVGAALAAFRAVGLYRAGRRREREHP